jgi:hypothetical protein
MDWKKLSHPETLKKRNMRDQTMTKVDSLKLKSRSPKSRKRKLIVKTKRTIQDKKVNQKMNMDHLHCNTVN